MTNQQPQSPGEANRSVYRGLGPTSIEGVEARDLPDKGRGSLETIAGKELRRKTPDRTGGTPDGDIGIAGSHEIGFVRNHGHRRHN